MFPSAAQRRAAAQPLRPRWRKLHEIAGTTHKASSGNHAARPGRSSKIATATPIPINRPTVRGLIGDSRKGLDCDALDRLAL